MGGVMRLSSCVPLVIATAVTFASCGNDSESGGTSVASAIESAPVATVAATDAASGEGVPDPAGRLAYGVIMDGHEHTDEQLMELYLVDVDGTDLVQLTEGNSAWPSWSPDGSRLAFMSTNDDGSAQIVTVAADGSDLTTLTSGAGLHEAPSWSPDGSWIAYDYSSVSPGQAGFHTVLYRMNADGSNQVVLGDPDKFDYEPKVSPDGKSVLFQRFEGGQEPVLIRDLKSGEETVVRFGGHNVDWSPDGKSIVVQTDPTTSGFIWGPLVRVDVADRSETDLYPPTATSGGFKPAYSPDGSRIAFGCGTKAGTPQYDEAICVMNADGTDVEVLVDTPARWDNVVSWGAAVS